MDSSTSASVSANITLLFPAGTVIPYVGTVASIQGLVAQGWLLCDGTPLKIANYKTLFSAIGTAFGGDGTTTFNLPDLRGQFLRGVDGGANVDPDVNSRTAQATNGNSGGKVGSRQGECLQNHQHYWDYNFGYITQGGSSLGVQLMDDSGPFNHNGLKGTKPTTNVDGGGNETRPVNVYVYDLIFAGLPGSSA